MDAFQISSSLLSQSHKEFLMMWVQKKQRKKTVLLTLTFLLVLLVFNISDSGAGIISFCRTAFSRKDTFLAEHDFKNPTAKTLVEGYQIIKGLKWFKRKQIKEFEKGLKEMVEFLEHPHSDTRQLQGLSIPLEVLARKSHEIIKFTKQSPQADAIYFRQITQAVLALFGKHFPSVLKNHSYQVDWPRINLIVKNIADFDIHNPRFSLYKIKRAIEGRYSLKEFILCRM